MPKPFLFGGAEEDRTPDLRIAKAFNPLFTAIPMMFNLLFFIILPHLPTRL